MEEISASDLLISGLVSLVIPVLNPFDIPWVSIPLRELGDDLLCSRSQLQLVSDQTLVHNLLKRLPGSI